MGKYIKLFENHSDYEDFIENEDFVLPNVSYCEDDEEVHYNPFIDYSKQYFTTIARDNGTIAFSIWRSMGTDMITSISYSTDDGSTWVTTNNTNNKSVHLSISVSVNEGDRVMWKGNATQLGYYDEDGYDDYVGSFFSSGCEFDVQGNIMSLLYGDDFIGETTIENDYEFVYLFSDYDGENDCFVVNAENLILPATTLANRCYYSMFSGCSSLIKAPELPATTLVYYCYDSMFSNCSSLIKAPELPVTTLAEGCYNNMFYACTGLTQAPELPATTLATNCYGSMFYACTSLTQAPEILPATILAEGCYSQMFQGCTSLIQAPELPAITLASYCYGYMFYGCTSLNFIKALFTTTPGASYTENWVEDVAASGTFIKSDNAQWNVIGVDGVPTGWTVETASA